MDPYTPQGGLVITRAMLAAANSGLGNCNRCRALLDDAAMLGIELPAVRSQLEEWQPKFEGLINYHAASQGIGNG